MYNEIFGKYESIKKESDFFLHTFQKIFIFQNQNFNMATFGKEGGRGRGGGGGGGYAMPYACHSLRMTQ